MLETKRRNSWAVTRKPSQDSNLSNSRNDSSATSNSTATWRLSRSSVSSDATSHSKSSFKRISHSTGGNPPVPSVVSTHPGGSAGPIPLTSSIRPLPLHGEKPLGHIAPIPSVIAEEDVSAVETSTTNANPQVSFILPKPSTSTTPVPPSDLPLKKKGKKKKKKKKSKKIQKDRISGGTSSHNSGTSSSSKKKSSSQNNEEEGDYIDDDEASAKIATNRPRLVRQSAFFSDEVVIEPEVCPVHGPLVPGTYDDENDENDHLSIDSSSDSSEEDSSSDDNENNIGVDPEPSSSSAVERDLESTGSQGRSILRKPSMGIAFVIVPRNLAGTGGPHNAIRMPISGGNMRFVQDNLGPFPSSSGGSVGNNVLVADNSTNNGGGGSTSPNSSPRALLLPAGFGRRKMSEQPVKFYVVPAKEAAGLLGSGGVHKWHSMTSVDVTGDKNDDHEEGATSPLLRGSRSSSPKDFRRQTEDGGIPLLSGEGDHGAIRDANERRVSFQLPKVE